MFRKATLLFFLLTSLSAATCWFFHVRLQPSDPAQYLTLVQESREIRSKRALEKEPAQQKREGVQKDLWLIHDGERIHLRIQGAHSHLILTQKGGKFDAVETLQNIACSFQELIERKENVQQVRSLFAKEGIYTYPAHRFTAEAVELKFYRLPGTELPLSFGGHLPYLTGIAHEVVLGAAMKMPTFTAYHLRAKFDPERHLP